MENDSSIREDKCEKCISFYKENYFSLLKHIEQSQRELSKYKEANKEAIEYIKANSESYLGETCDGTKYYSKDDETGKELLKILEEVEDE